MKKIKLPILWAIFTAMVFFACGDIADPLLDGYDDGDMSYYSGITIGAKFIKVGEMPILDHNTHWYWSVYIEDKEINEFRVSDIMAIFCVIGHAPQVYPPRFPIDARIMSLKTGDVQYISFVQDPINYAAWMMPTYWYIAYISPVKYVKYEDGSVDLIPDPEKKQLKIDPKGDILIAQIKYRYHILTITIPVKGD